MVTLLVAASENDVIGNANALPWHLPRDLQTFKALTTGHVCIMGRKTFDSILARIEKPLPDRTSIVITRQTDFSAPEGVIVAHTWEEAVARAEGREIFVCGGEAIYQLALPHVDRIILTRVHTQVDGTVRLPNIDFSDWNLTYEEQWPRDEKNEHDATYQIYERRS